eukprot:2895714-Rhodomonas_salina.4
MIANITELIETEQKHRDRAAPVCAEDCTARVCTGSICARALSPRLVGSHLFSTGLVWSGPSPTPPTANQHQHPHTNTNTKTKTNNNNTTTMIKGKSEADAPMAAVAGPEGMTETHDNLVFDAHLDVRQRVALGPQQGPRCLVGADDLHSDGVVGGLTEPKEPARQRYHRK